MAITPDEAAAKIDQRIEELQMLKKVTGNPRLLALLKSIFEDDQDQSTDAARISIGGEAHKTTRPRAPRKQKGDLMKAVLEAAKGLSGRFTGSDIAEKMKASGFVFEAAEP